MKRVEPHASKTFPPFAKFSFVRLEMARSIAQIRNGRFRRVFGTFADFDPPIGGGYRLIVA